MTELILASTSEARRALMDGLRIPYRAVSPGIEEVVAKGATPGEAALSLARQKAEAVRRTHPEALVLGADQVGEVEGELLRKPGSLLQARSQLSRLSGREHRLWLGVCLVGPGFAREHTEVATLRLYPLGEDELERYLRLGEWRGCAGSYRVEGAGQALLERLEGDRTAVMGLPMLAVVRMLREAGLRFFEG